MPLSDDAVQELLSDLDSPELRAELKELVQLSLALAPMPSRDHALTNVRAFAQELKENPARLIAVLERQAKDNAALALKALLIARALQRDVRQSEAS
jgi:hypothetical protein